MVLTIENELYLSHKSHTVCYISNFLARMNIAHCIIDNGTIKIYEQTATCLKEIEVCNAVNLLRKNFCAVIKSIEILETQSEIDVKVKSL